MKFPRNARIFRGQLDAAPFVSVFFLLVIFVLLFTLPGSLLHTAGVRVELPASGNVPLPGSEHPTISVAMDKVGNLYYENDLITERDLSNQLSVAVQKVSEPLTLVVQADKEVAQERSIRLALLARSTGITNVLLATLPRAFDSTTNRP
jgi:biopolymer transport protein ExbD